ncbi:MAG: adenosylcobalamin-dependent ribonucleoside-diphosphate reductase [Candidatus Brocadiales bacterium]|nr:adenosylcobalamin-dependent ribonucleoside-diphosphate reductase [Candidatus Brocadiales bacterium]
MSRKRKNHIILTPNARLVLERRYLKKNTSGEVIESPEDLFRRVARNIAQADALYDKNADIKAVEEKFYKLLSNLEFLPNSPALMNAGREMQQLAACFVLPVEDSIEQIFETIKQATLIHKSGGGTGFPFSKIRPKNDLVSTSGGRASGPISFMKVFNEATEAINQGGFRRGANMAVLRVDHPDILEFINAKRKEGVLINFNISVGVTDAFMKAVEEDGQYELINPNTGKPVKKISTREVFDQIVDSAWDNGEPGLLFLDRINAANPTPALGQIEGTNPCGEQPLLPYESCVLGSINLSKMVKIPLNPPLQKGDIRGIYEVDWEKLADTIEVGVHFLDNLIDMNKFPLPQIERITKGNRKVGLGVMGFADMLIRLGIPYDSEEAISVAEKLMKFFAERANQASIELARKRGVFPNFEKSIYNKAGCPRYRNATRTTVAPAGTISIIAGCSSGIEPLYAVSYVRHILDNSSLPETHPLFEEIAKKKGFYSEALIDEISRNGGTIQGLNTIPDEIKRLFVIARDIPAEWHVKIQSAFQKYVDSAVSKTVNFSRSTSKDDVRRVFLLAYNSGCKGVTVYRDMSRISQALSSECVCQK